jgi:hypothetical protein
LSFLFGQWAKYLQPIDKVTPPPKLDISIVYHLQP